MPYYNSSSAREFLPEEFAAPVKEQPKTSHRYRVIRREQTEPQGLRYFSFRNFLVFAFIVGSICFMLYNQTVLNEINGEISQVRSEITQLESEQIRMQSSLESSLSLRSVERQAEQELGLQRLDQYQTEYVSIYEHDRVELLEVSQPDGFSDKVENFFINVFDFVTGIFRR